MTKPTYCQKCHKETKDLNRVDWLSYIGERLVYLCPNCQSLWAECFYDLKNHDDKIVQEALHKFIKLPFHEPFVFR